MEARGREHTPRTSEYERCAVERDEERNTGRRAQADTRKAAAAAFLPRHDELGGTVDRRCNKVDKGGIGRHSEIDEERDTPARVVVVGQR